MASFRPNQDVAVISAVFFSTTGNYNRLVCDYELLGWRPFPDLGLAATTLPERFSPSRGVLQSISFPLMVQSPGSTMLLEALRINVCACVLFFGLVLLRHQTCHVKQHFKEKRKTSIQSVIVAGYIIIKYHFRTTSGLCNWPPQHEVDLLFTLFCCETPVMFFFFQQPLQSTQKTLHTQSESNASQSMPD